MKIFYLSALLLLLFVSIIQKKFQLITSAKALLKKVQDVKEKQMLVVIMFSAWGIIRI